MEWEQGTGSGRQDGQESTTARLLLVDDDPDTLRILREFLEEQGYGVSTANDLNDACARIREARFDLILTELIPGGERDRDLLRHVRQSGGATQVVVMAGEATVPDIQRVLHAGAAAVVQKPLQLDLLRQAVVDAIHRGRSAVRQSSLLQRLQERNRVLTDELRRAKERMEQRMLRDDATGLLGYHAFRSFLESDLSRAIASKDALALVMLDVDRFTEFNRERGYEEGTNVLRALGDLLRRELRSSDRIFRYESDQFALILCGTAASQAKVCASRLIERVREGDMDAPCAPGVSISAGIAVAPENGTRAEDLLNAAEGALDAAKAAGPGAMMRA